MHVKCTNIKPHKIKSLLINLLNLLLERVQIPPAPPHNLPRTSRQVLKSTENRIFFKRIRFFYVHISPYTSTPFHGKSAQISAQLLTHQFSWAQIQFRIAEITYATDDYGGLTRRPQTPLSTPPHPLTVNVRS